LIRTTTRSAPARSRPWPAYAAATWSGLFAIRGVYWALGGTVGLSTLSTGIKEAHDAGDPALFAALWMTVVLEVFGVGLALSLVRAWGRTFPARVPVVRGRTVPIWLPVLPAFGAGALLIGHGALFSSFGLRAASGAFDVTSEVLWYSLFWGPWFMTGGVLFTLAAYGYLTRSSEPGTPRRRIGVLAAAAGVAGGLLAAAAPIVVSAIASRA
jgi:hypothetical protein